MESREIADLKCADQHGESHRVRVFQDYRCGDPRERGEEPEWIPLPHLRFVVDDMLQVVQKPHTPELVMIPEAGIIIRLDAADLP